MPCLYIFVSGSVYFTLLSLYVTETGPCYSRMNLASPVIWGNVFNLFSHQLHLEDHLKLYLADVLQAQREGLSQEGLHVDFIPLDPNTHSQIKPPHHVDWVKKSSIDRVACLCSTGSCVVEGWIKLNVKLCLCVDLSLTHPECETQEMNSRGRALEKIKYVKNDSKHS